MNRNTGLLRPLAHFRVLPFLLLAAAASFFAAPARAADPAEQNWPQWRGPLGTGVAPAADPPTSWNENSNIKWKIQIPGSGQSTPVVWGNCVFVETAIDTGKKPDAAAQPAAAPAAPPPGRGTPPGRGGGRGFGGLTSGPPGTLWQFVLLCIDRQTGKTVWEKTCKEVVPHEGHHPSEGTYAAGSPITDGQRVYAFFGSRGLHCYDMAGNLQWSQDFGQMRIAMGFGEGSSPTISGNSIIVNWDNEGESFITAIDKMTGKPLWKTPRDEKTSWATPLVVEYQGKKQVVTAATSKVRSYDLESGKLIWECTGLTRNVIPSPVAADGIVYATSGYTGNAVLAIRLGQSGVLTGTDAIAWTYKKGTPYTPSPLLYDGRFYMFSSNNAVLSCLDAKAGKPLIDSKTLDGLDGAYASPVGAAGRVYLLARNGACMVIKASDKLEVLATNTLDGAPGKFDASPVAVGKELFIRGAKHLYCIAEK